MNNRGIPPTSSILWFYPSMLHGYIPIIFLCGCRIGQAGLTTKYPEHPLAKGEEGSVADICRDGDAERASK